MTALYYVMPLPSARRYFEMNVGIESTVSMQREIVRSLRSRTWLMLS